MKKFLVGFILFAMVFSVIPGAMAEASYDLYAGKDEYAGTVTVWVEGDLLYFEYKAAPGWCICEIHLTALNEAPEVDKENIWYVQNYTTKKGNPRPGQFEINDCFEPCVTEYLGTLNLTKMGVDPCDTLYIAAHAVVCGYEVIGSECIEADDSWAVDYENYIMGVNTGNPLDRYDPERCLGVANVLSGDRENFTSLGRNGSIELFFENEICGDGNESTPDLEVYEITYNQNTNWEELITVEAFYDGSYHHVGSALNADGSTAVNDSFINYFNLPCECIEKIRINDTSTGVSGTQVFDYDIDGVKANYWCVPEYNCTYDCETAWANGTGFPGKNWATYFVYDGCIPD